MKPRLAAPFARLLLPALATLAIGFSGCASSGPYWSQQDQNAAINTELREKVARLEAQLASADQRNAALQARADALESEVVQLRARAEAPPVAPRPESGAPPAAPGLRDRSEIEQSDLDDIGQAQGALPAEAPVEPPSNTSNGPRELYEHSLELLEQHDLSEAEEGFRRFLAENPYSDLADNAQFWLAESALRRDDIAAALAGFRAVVENYPEGNKVPDALLKVGFCLASLGETASAATVYRELLLRFPESPAAQTARQRLAALP